MPDTPLSVTIKFPESERYAGDGPWMVFYGTVEDITKNIIKAFDLNRPDFAGSLSDVVLEAQSFASSTGKLANQAGGRSLGSGATGGTSSAKATVPAKEYTLLDEIETITDLPALTVFYADNKAELDINEEWLNAWKAKGRALRDAA